MTNEARTRNRTLWGEVFSDESLTFKAKGLLALIMSLEGLVKITVAVLVEYAKDGVGSVKSALRELEESGYLVCVKGKQARGRFSAVEYKIAMEVEPDVTVSENCDLTEESESLIVKNCTRSTEANATFALVGEDEKCDNESFFDGESVNCQKSHTVDGIYLYNINNNNKINNKINTSHTNFNSNNLFYLFNCKSKINSNLGKDEKSTFKKFKKPTLDEVKAFCDEIKSEVDAMFFFDYYTKRGWTRGAGIPIADWRISLKIWDNNKKQWQERVCDTSKTLRSALRRERELKADKEIHIIEDEPNFSVL